MCQLFSTPSRTIVGHVWATTDIPCVQRDFDLTMQSTTNSHFLSECLSAPLHSTRFENAISGSGQIFP